MQQSHDLVCPWCHTEIVWDPEFGPEEACPHCFNELSDYRSLKLGVDSSDEDDDEEERKDVNKADHNDKEKLLSIDEELEDDELDDYDEEDRDGLDEYEEGVQRVLATQEDPPECTNCHSFMMFTGTQTAAPGYVPVLPVMLDQPLLKVAYTTKVYVCPSCFKMDYILADEDRLAMVELLKNQLT
ncbi:hypothetical protein [Paenibacillus agricola]|uniref:Uncharacterized protein n=1 Tax=Paenibacillus agricola TaxID=2716264 RepID=A0ABX0J0R8_9BACL|nr:hypothetical protein [Paenibacillus agricola]NHN29283.1 hypothetical protein [Paenibacillus agricola]